MKKHWFFFLVLATVSQWACATEDPEIRIIDSYLGSTESQIFIYQDVFHYGGYLTQLRTEKWLLVKEIENGKLVLKEKREVRSNQDVGTIFTLPDFALAIPDNVPSRYLQLYSSENDRIVFFGSEFRVRDLLPKELWPYDIDKVECSYRWGGHVLIILDLVSPSGIEYLRKVVLLK